MTQSDPTNKTSPPLLPVLMVHFIGNLGYSIIIPFLVFLVKKFGGNELVYGLLGSIYPAFQFFGAPILGKWSDIYGRKKILFLSQAGTLIAWIVFLIALILPIEKLVHIDTNLGPVIITLPLVFLFFARALDGITGGNISVANAYLSDISDEGNRKANFGKMAMAMSLGFILGPALAGILGATPLNETLPVLAAALISLVGLYLIYFHLPESKTSLVEPDIKRFRIRKIFTVEEKECYKMKNCPDNRLQAVLKIKNIPFMILIYFLVFLGFSLFFAAFPLHSMNRLGWSVLELGVFFSYLSGLMILVQGPLLGYISKKVDEEPLVIAGSFLLAVNFVLMSFNDVSLVYAGAALYALGNGLMWPSFLSLLSKMGGDKQQGAVQGVANSAGSLASIIGMIGGGFLYGLIGEATFMGAAGLLILIGFLSFRLIRIKPSPPIAQPA